MKSQYSLNVFIYDASWTHRLKLKRIIQDYVENNHIEIGVIISTDQPRNIMNQSQTSAGIYLLNIDDLRKKTDWITFAINVRNNDLAGSIIFLTKHNIFTTGRYGMAICSLRNHVVAMSFLAKDSSLYYDEIKACITAHIRKMSKAFQI